MEDYQKITKRLGRSAKLKRQPPKQLGGLGAAVCCIIHYKFTFEFSYSCIICSSVSLSGVQAALPRP